MKRKIQIGFLLLIGILGLGLGTNFIFAEDTAEQLQQKINERTELIKKLDEEIKTYADLADKSSKEAQTLNNYIKTLDNQVKATSLDIKKSQSSIDKTNLEITKLSTAIVGNEEKIARLRSGMEESIVNQYKLDDVSIIENFLAEKDILASVREIEVLKNIQNSIQSAVDEIFQVKQGLEVDKTEEQVKKGDLEKEKEKLKTKQTSLSIVKNTQAKELEITKNQESNFKKILAERKKQKEAFEKEMFEYEKKLKYVLDPSSIPKSGTGALGWPLEAVRITQVFGSGAGVNKRLYSSGTHNGVDFGAKIGTPVLAMGDGVLVAQGDTDAVCRGVSFGKWILIKYSNGLASTYGHLSQLNMQTGTTVKAGDVVGFSGNSGYSTGPHLHVSMYPANAVNAISRPSASCPGVNLTMPVSAVNAYLDPLAYMPKR
ncbi:peptidoglycan DD-metalloendopeptidase family protein [Candidatus Parcubacteria bacterium]|nr:peptidoglycan DD-metalloendopeptidase family protein [Candidatus Parcubacteria bacterium]